MTLTLDEAILERFDLASERLLEIPEEHSLPEGLFLYFKEVADYLGGVSYFGKIRRQRPLFESGLQRRSAGREAGRPLVCYVYGYDGLLHLGNLGETGSCYPDDGAAAFDVQHGDPEYDGRDL